MRTNAPDQILGTRSDLIEQMVQMKLGLRDRPLDLQAQEREGDLYQSYFLPLRHHPHRKEPNYVFQTREVPLSKDLQASGWTWRRYKTIR